MRKSFVRRLRSRKARHFGIALLGSATIHCAVNNRGPLMDGLSTPARTDTMLGANF